MSNYTNHSEKLDGLHGESLDVSFIAENGLPAGGDVSGVGLQVSFQAGPVKEVGGRNGAFVEDLIMAAIARLKWYQSGEFECDENESAIHHLCLALDEMDNRTKSRQQRGVEGKHEK